MLTRGDRRLEVDALRTGLFGDSAGDALYRFAGQRAPIVGDTAAAGNDRVAGIGVGDHIGERQQRRAKQRIAAQRHGFDGIDQLDHLVHGVDAQVRRRRVRRLADRLQVKLGAAATAAVQVQFGRLADDDKIGLDRGHHRLQADALHHLFHAPWR